MVLVRKKKNELTDILEEEDESLSVLETEKKEVVPTPQKQEVSEEPKPIPKSAPVPTEAPKSISIKDALSGKGQPQPDKHKEESTEQDVDEELYGDITDEDYEEFGQDEVEQVWVKYIKTELGDKPRYSSLMQTYIPVLMPDYLLVVEVESALQVEMFRELRNDLLLFLQTELENKRITLEIRENENAGGGEKLYTQEDKFNYLSQINPEIGKLRQQLNLDFD